MNDQKLLEHYLHELEQTLGQLPPSQRAKIVHETHDHVHQVRQNYPEKTIAQILDDLGPAAKLGNHHLLDNNLKTYKPKRSPFIKWLSIGFIGSVSAFFLFVVFLIIKFSPLYHLDEKNNRLVILGGLIDLNVASGQYKVFDQYQFVPSNKFTNQFNGSIDVPREEFDELVINFKSGTLDIKTSVDRRFMWDCKLENPPEDDFINMSKDMIDIDLEKTGGANCELVVPSDLKLTVQGDAGQVTLTEPEFDAYVELVSGNVIIRPGPEVEYKYDLKVANGTIERAPQSSTNPDAYEVRATVENGKISFIQ